MAKSKKAKPDADDPRAPVARDGAYVMMLFITFVAIVAGTVFMYLDAEEYGGKSPPKEMQITILKLGDAPPAAKTDGTTPPPPGGGGGGGGMPGMP